MTPTYPIRAGMTTPDRARLRELSAAATSGPWHRMPDTPHVVDFTPKVGGPFAVIHGDRERDQNVADAAFIVALVNAYRAGELVPAAPDPAGLREAAIAKCAGMPCIRQFWGSSRPCPEITPDELCGPCQARAALTPAPRRAEPLHYAWCDDDNHGYERPCRRALTTNPAGLREDDDVDTSRAHKGWCSALVTGCDCGYEAALALATPAPLDVERLAQALERGTDAMDRDYIDNGPFPVNTRVHRLAEHIAAEYARLATDAGEGGK